MANQGVTDHDTLEGIAPAARTGGVSTSTLGVGLGYDEELMSAVARGGAGNALFAEEADTAGALIAGEVDDSAGEARGAWTDFRTAQAVPRPDRQRWTKISRTITPYA